MDGPGWTGIELDSTYDQAAEPLHTTGVSDTRGVPSILGHAVPLLCGVGGEHVAAPVRSWSALFDVVSAELREGLADDVCFALVFHVHGDFDGPVQRPIMALFDAGLTRPGV